MPNKRDSFCGGFFDFNSDGKTSFFELMLGFKILDDMEKRRAARENILKMQLQTTLSSNKPIAETKESSLYETVPFEAPAKPEPAIDPNSDEGIRAQIPKVLSDELYSELKIKYRRECAKVALITIFYALMGIYLIYYSCENFTDGDYLNMDVALFVIMLLLGLALAVFNIAVCYTAFHDYKVQIRCLRENYKETKENSEHK